MVKALRERYAPTEWAFISELSMGTGYGIPGRIDGWALRCWQGHPGYEAVGFEIKASRSDFLRERRNPKWQQYLELCDRFWFVVADGVTNINEFAEGFKHDGYTPGLMRFTPGQGLRIIKQARRIRPRTEGMVELPRGFWAAAIRSALLTDAPFNGFTGQKGRRV